MSNLVKITRILTVDEGLTVHEINVRCGTLQPDRTGHIGVRQLFCFLRHFKSLNEDLNFIRQPSLKNQTSRHCVNEMQMCAPALTRAVFLSFCVLLCPSTVILAFEWLSIRVTLFSFKFCRAHPPSSPLPRGFGWEKKRIKWTKTEKMKSGTN